MNATQQQYLLNRLDEARRSKPSRYDDVKLNQPTLVTRALAEIERLKKVIAKWQRKCYLAKDTRNKKMDAAYNTVRTAILFKDSATALRALDHYEKLTF